ncbi:hypothetical protein VHEMI02533 [[Torrubiella] hemipterigena]|uniref:FHA domain-containing protein n=1 Tax=[Torrubiella] hemipterigena TaxID=1531966 RepID=A0A0A1SW14_9HYPO|nr:hypothetical protein VHEMI02533 [[Torrubiella] hemipterigena]
MSYLPVGAFLVIYSIDLQGEPANRKYLMELKDEETQNLSDGEYDDDDDDSRFRPKSGTGDETPVPEAYTRKALILRTSFTFKDLAHGITFGKHENCDVAIPANMHSVSGLQFNLLVRNGTLILRNCRRHRTVISSQSLGYQKVKTQRATPENEAIDVQLDCSLCSV